HVMAQESFEDEQTAQIINDLVVPIKVDREERPDVDAVYMTATQAMTGQGGWPMTVFLTPDREPFYCGTYYPRDHFRQLVGAVAWAWRENREAVVDQAEKITAALTETAGLRPATSQLWTDGAGVDNADAAGAGLGGSGTEGPDSADARLCDAAIKSVAKRYDAERGGFGNAPKFPPSTLLEFLLRTSERPGGNASGPLAGSAGAGAAGAGSGDRRALVDQGAAVGGGGPEGRGTGGGQQPRLGR